MSLSSRDRPSVEESPKDLISSYFLILPVAPVVAKCYTMGTVPFTQLLIILETACAENRSKSQGRVVRGTQPRTPVCVTSRREKDEDQKADDDTWWWARVGGHVFTVRVKIIIYAHGFGRRYSNLAK